MTAFIGRREFITLLGGAAAAWPLAARAQQPERMRRIGVLMAYAESDPEGQASVRRVPARDSRSSGGRTAATSGSTLAGRQLDAESMQRFAKELIALQPDLILSSSTPTTAALLQQTRTIPIIFAIVVDPVGSGFVASLSRPGGNVTGFTTMEPLAGRQVAGAAQGDCAARRPGRLPVQPGNGAICRILPEPLQSRRSVLRGGGDRSTCSRHVRARIRRCRTGSRRRMVALS